MPRRTAETAPIAWEAAAPEYRAIARIDGGARLDRPAVLDIALETRGAFHVNDDYPHRFTALAAAGLDYGSPRIEAVAMAYKPCPGSPERRCSMQVAVPFTARAAGPLRVGGELAFGACDAERCIIEKLQVAVAVDVSR